MVIYYMGPHVSDAVEVLLGEGDGRHNLQTQQALPQLLEAQLHVAVHVRDLTWTATAEIIIFNSMIFHFKQCCIQQLWDAQLHPY